MFSCVEWGKGFMTSGYSLDMSDLKKLMLASASAQYFLEQVPYALYTLFTKSRLNEYRFVSL